MSGGIQDCNYIVITGACNEEPDLPHVERRGRSGAAACAVVPCCACSALYPCQVWAMGRWARLG